MFNVCQYIKSIVLLAQRRSVYCHFSAFCYCIIDFKQKNKYKNVVFVVQGDPNRNFCMLIVAHQSYTTPLLLSKFKNNFLPQNGNAAGLNFCQNYAHFRLFIIIHEISNSAQKESRISNGRRSTTQLWQFHVQGFQNFQKMNFHSQGKKKSSDQRSDHRT